MRYVIVVVLALLVLACGAAPADPGRVAMDFLEATRDGNVSKLFDLDALEQENVARIRANNPKVLWDQLIKEARNNFATRWQQRSSNRSPFERMLGLKPTIKILEVRPSPESVVVYARLSYREARSSPLTAESPIAEGPGMPAKFVRQGIVQVSLLPATSLVMRAQIVDKSLEYWSEEPFLLISVSFRGAGDIHLNFAGGTPPYRSRVSCGNKTLAASSTGIQNDRSLKVTIPVYEGVCFVDAEDASGGRDRSRFKLRKRDAPKGSLGLVGATLDVDWWGREPWQSAGFGGLLFGGIGRIVSTIETASDEDLANAQRSADRTDPQTGMAGVAGPLAKEAAANASATASFEVPDTLSAIEKTTADIRNLGIAIMSAAMDDESHWGLGCVAGSDGPIDPNSIQRLDAGTVRRLLQPGGNRNYMHGALPLADAWGKDLEFRYEKCSAAKSSSSPHLIIRSSGRNGVFERSYEVGQFEIDAPADDIVWVNGFFVRGFKGSKWYPFEFSQTH